MAIDWSLAAKPYDALEVLRAYGTGQQDRYRAKQIEWAVADRQRTDAARDALGDVYRSGSSATLPMPTTASPGTSLLAINPNGGGGPSTGAPAVPTSGFTGAQAAQPGPSSAIAGLMDLGRQADPRRAALDRLSRYDPEAAFKVDADQRKATKEQLAILHDLNTQAYGLLSGVTDQATYDQARQQAETMYGQYGLHLNDLGIPDAYDPATVQRLRLHAMDMDKQLAAERADRRLDGDIADDQADNERADRNTDSVIVDRRARRELTARGQNVASTDRRRGQDMIDRRARDGGGRRAASIVKVRTPAEAMALPSGTRFQAPDGKIKVRP